MARTRRGVSLSILLLLLSFVTPAQSQTAKPNMVVIFGDDIGCWNVSAYSHGKLGWTPNIDSIAKNGILFTDHFGQPSCTAGWAAFIGKPFFHPVRVPTP